MKLFLLYVAAVAFLVLVFSAGTAIAQKKSNHGSRRADKALNDLDEGTRKRVLAMKNAGMPPEAIAKKIKYEVGNKGTARRMMEKMNVEENKKNWKHQQKQKFMGKESVLKAKTESSKKKTRKERIKNSEL
jgi:hypothetical protein